ncbi:unnamed protein product, partial [Ectocarpus sp. 6 AP-2014]
RRKRKRRRSHWREKRRKKNGKDGPTVGCKLPSRQASIIVGLVPTVYEDGSFSRPDWMAPGLKSPKSIAAAFRQRFPEAPICRPVGSPEKRAWAAMQPSEATEKIRSRATVGESTNQGLLGQLLKDAAMAVFATLHVVFLVYLLEVVFFDVLVNIPVTTRSGATSVRMICPGCRSNKFMEPPGVSGHGWSNVSATKIRAIPDVGRAVVPLSGRYACTNLECPLVLASAKNAAIQKKVDFADDGRDEATIRKWYPNGATFTTQDDRDMRRYMSFAEKHWDGTWWPGGKFVRGTLVATPSVVVLNTIYNAGHDEDHMRRGIQVECKGEFFNMDGTWRIGLRVPGVPACLYFLMSETSKVHDFGAITCESKAQLRPLFMRCA